MKKSIHVCRFLLMLSLLTGCSDASDDGRGKNIPAGLPADPGVAGKKTLAGIDSDNDGVRDDIQRCIAIEYQDSEKTRRVLTDKAKADQAFMLNADDKEKVLEANAEQHKAIDCLWYIDPETASTNFRKLKAQVLNTEERIRAWRKADSHLGGMTFSLPLDGKAQCNFDPDQLEN